MFASLVELLIAFFNAVPTIESWRAEKKVEAQSDSETKLVESEHQKTDNTRRPQSTFWD